MKIVKRLLVPLSEKGTALLELGIALPTLVILIVGLVGYGVTLRKIQVLSAAAKHGARTASIQQSMSCCGNIPADLSGCPGAPNIQSIAWCATNTYLQNADLNPEQWVVESEVVPKIEDGLQILTTHVTIKTNDANADCVLCNQNIVHIAKMIGAESSFAIQNGCTDVDDC